MSASVRPLRRAGLAVGALAVTLAGGTVLVTSADVTRSGADRHGALTRTVDARPTSATPPASIGTPAVAVPASGAHLAWSDEFNGPAGAPPSPGNWRPEVGGNGFGNQELECNTDNLANSAQDGAGHLAITAVRELGHRCSDGAATDYTSARLSTANLATLRYGMVRVRARLPAASGLWPGIWALGADHETVGWPQSGELDIAEAVGTSPDTVFQTVHGPSRAGTPYSLGTHYSIGQPLSSGFHTYGLDWSPQRITFSVDGDASATYTRAEVEKQGTWVFDQPFYLLLDVAVGGTFPGPPTDPSVFPQRMLIDYVRVYT